LDWRPCNGELMMGVSMAISNSRVRLGEEGQELKMCVCVRVREREREREEVHESEEKQLKKKLFVG
jgi:hypothetical protein